MKTPFPSPRELCHQLPRGGKSRPPRKPYCMYLFAWEIKAVSHLIYHSRHERTLPASNE